MTQTFAHDYTSRRRERNEANFETRLPARMKHAKTHSIKSQISHFSFLTLLYEREGGEKKRVGAKNFSKREEKNKT